MDKWTGQVILPSILKIVKLISTLKLISHLKVTSERTQ